MRFSRVKARRGWAAIAFRSANSVAVSATALPAHEATCSSASIASLPRVSFCSVSAANPLRRSTAFTRATSSRGLNGFTT